MAAACVFCPDWVSFSDHLAPPLPSGDHLAPPPQSGDRSATHRRSPVPAFVCLFPFAAPAFACSPSPPGEKTASPRLRPDKVKGKQPAEITLVINFLAFRLAKLLFFDGFRTHEATRDISFFSLFGYSHVRY